MVDGRHCIVDLLYMGVFRKCYYREFYILIIFIYFSACLFGQSYDRFQGPFSLGTYSGNADFLYELSGEDTILDGSFFLQSFDLDQLVSDTDQYLKIAGTFKKGLPDSLWRFEFGNFSISEGAEFIDNLFKVRVNGIQQVTIAQFQEGKPQGEWTQTVRNIRQSEAQDTIFASRVSYEHGIAQGSAFFQNDSKVLLGRFRRNGNAHDIWELTYNGFPENIEKWYFTDGRLEQIFIKQDSDSISFKVYENEIQRSKVIHLDQRYIKILSLQKVFDQAAYLNHRGGMTELFGNNASYYQKIDSAFFDLDSLSGKVLMPTLGVKVPYYPLDKEEVKQLEVIREDLQKIDTVSQNLLSDTRLNILKHSNEEILFLLSAVEQISVDYLSPVRKVLQYDKEHLLDFFPREQMMLPSDAEPTSLNEINVSYEDSSGLRNRVFKGPETAPIAPNSIGFEYLAYLARYGRICTESIEKNLNKNLRRDKLQQEFEDLERTLLKEEDRLTAIIDSLNHTLPEEYQPTLAALPTTAKREIRKYAEEDKVDSKPDQVKELIQCMKALEELAFHLAKLPDRWKSIMDLYNEEVWNPFTSTIMNDQIKESITQAYGEFIVPSILERIQEELSCSNTQEFSLLLDAAYEKTQQLRTENTSKLERKLRNEEDPKVVMELFQISM